MFLQSLVRQFLIATTAKDISLLFTIGVKLDEVLDTNWIPCPCTPDRSCPVKFTFTLGVCDLDAKSAAKIPAYLQLDQEILKSVSQVLLKSVPVADQPQPTSELERLTQSAAAHFAQATEF
jgi:hypothetical protein